MEARIPKKNRNPGFLIGVTVLSAVPFLLAMLYFMSLMRHRSGQTAGGGDALMLAAVTLATYVLMLGAHCITSYTFLRWIDRKEMQMTWPVMAALAGSFALAMAPMVYVNFF